MNSSQPALSSSRPHFPRHIDVLAERMNKRRESLNQALDQHADDTSSSSGLAKKIFSNLKNGNSKNDLKTDFSSPSDQDFKTSENAPKGSEKWWWFVLQLMLSHWWKQQPVRLLLPMTKNVLSAQIKRNPGKFIVAGLLLGSALALFKPWQRFNGFASLFAGGLTASALNFLKTKRSR